VGRIGCNIGGRADERDEDWGHANFNVAGANMRPTADEQLAKVEAMFAAAAAKARPLPDPCVAAMYDEDSGDA